MGGNTSRPTAAPTRAPTPAPTYAPTPAPTYAPTTRSPTGSPTPAPTLAPTIPRCYPDYIAGSKYTAGDPVSESVTETIPEETERCSDRDGTDATCTNGVRITSPEMTMNVKYNYECKSNDWCGSLGFGPGEQYEGLAWEKKEKCEGIADLIEFILDSWRTTNDGCPTPYVPGTDYDAGSVVSVDKGGYSLVYSCTGEPSNQFCGQTGYEPGTGQHWANVWTALGSCTGSLYPTASPNFDALEDVGGCPDEWVKNTATTKYEEGDMVAKNGLVLQCKAWPMSGHCGQDGYQPLDEDASTADAWKDAWELKGYCQGTTGPTASPIFDDLEEIGDGCPKEWSASDVSGYEYGDLVSIEVSDSPERKVVYQCREWPNGDHCTKNADSTKPGARYGHLGWRIKGSCDGSIAPTMAPTPFSGSCQYIKCETDTCNGGEPAASFWMDLGSTACSCDANPPTGSVCTQKTCNIVDIEHWSSSTTYESGDYVRISGDRYRCKNGNVSGWCNVAAYQPTREAGIWTNAWTKDGTMSCSKARKLAPKSRKMMAKAAKPRMI